MYKYLNPKNYARALLRAVNVYGISGLESLGVKNPEEPLRHPPIFILGAPRSGSTLAIQVLTDALDFGYISNCHCRWFGAPALAERLFHQTANRPKSDYSSSHGITSGIHAPAECGEWWYRFFRRAPPYVALADVEPRKMYEFRRAVAALTNAFDRPILFKNLYASLRIQPIAHYLPESLFIVINRNEVDNGHSLLEARLKRFGSYQPWLSVEPPDAERLKTLPAHEQVINQIRHTYTTIDFDLKQAGVSPSRRFDLVYEEFCDDPASAVNSLQAFLVRNGCYVKDRRVAIPVSFVRRSHVRIDAQVYQAMVEYSRSSL